MIATETITGTVESNNGTEALVRFADGARKLFERGAESETEFLQSFLSAARQKRSALRATSLRGKAFLTGSKTCLATGKSRTT